jgi:hypothetical protein
VHEGGGWALVRRVQAGTRWHPATDDLQGTDTYGTPVASDADGTFSRMFSSLIKGDDTEFLFATGNRNMF